MVLLLKYLPSWVGEYHQEERYRTASKMFPCSNMHQKHGLPENFNIHYHLAYDIQQPGVWYTQYSFKWLKSHFFLYVPKLEVFVLVPKVRVGLLPKSPPPVVVPNEGALVVVVPNPAGLLPNRVWKEEDMNLETWQTDIKRIALSVSL